MDHGQSDTSPDDHLPLPPDRLRYKVAGTENAEWFDKSGRMSVQDLTQALASVGKSLNEFGTILEWGCGCGRILRHLPRHAGARICGNDIDHDAISWVNENLPWVETSITDGMPPLPYADNSFDLIFNHSVMTHLDRVYQDAWLAELRRVLRSEGIITLTVSGPHAFQIFLDPQDSSNRVRYTEDLHRKGILYIAQDQWTGDFPDFYHSTFHDVGYVFNHWSKFLDLRSYIPRGSLDYQDMVVLQKPADGSASRRFYQDHANLERAARQDEPQSAVAKMQPETSIASPIVEDVEHLINDLRREMTAQQCELRQSQDARMRAEAELVKVDLQLRQIYASRSWLLTKPWRLVGTIIKQLIERRQSQRPSHVSASIGRSPTSRR
jgi:SAM-dependent methyltransferase